VEITFKKNNCSGEDSKVQPEKTTARQTSTVVERINGAIFSSTSILARGYEHTPA
jgi:hypothetical protein